jgi:hypothetical protein
VTHRLAGGLDLDGLANQHAAVLVDGDVGIKMEDALLFFGEDALVLVVLRVERQR